MNEKDEVIHLHLDDIIPNRFQPREVFDERALKELAISIKEHGVIQPIIVRKINDNKYEIIAGERRYKASALAGMTKIPAIVRNLDDKEAAKVALLENLQRKNLNAIEEARTYQKIIELDEITQEELAKTMGKSQSAVANKLRLLALPDEVQDSLLKEEISERHARALLNLDDTEDQKKMLKKIINEKMTVRQLENEIKEKNMPQHDTLKDNKDLNSLINPTPVAIEKEAINSNMSSGTKFLMDPNYSEKKEQPNQLDSIINYGEINDDDDNEVEEFQEQSDNGPIDLTKIRENTFDINEIPPKETEKNETNDLESLLNIEKPQKSYSPAEEALRESDNKNYENKEDYFTATDLMSINIPNNNISSKKENKDDKINSQPNKFSSILDFSTATPPLSKSKNESLTDVGQTLFQRPIEKNDNTKKLGSSLGMALMNENLHNNKKNQIEQLNIQQMVNEIRKTITNLEMHGAKIDTDEMNFENQYQILIKIDKNSNY